MLARGALVLLASSASLSPAQTGAVRVVVDASATRQTIDGFGFSVRTWTDPHMSNQPTTWVPDWAQTEVLRRLYREMGATRSFLTIDGGIEPVNDNADPFVLNASAFNFTGRRSDEQVQYIRQAKPVGLEVFYPKVMAFEKWMTPAQTDEYVEWAMALLLHWRSLGAEPPYYSLINEPRGSLINEWWLRVVKGLGARMRKAGLRTMLVIPEEINACVAVPAVRAVLADPEARAYVGAIAYHEYEYQANAAECRAQLRQLAQAAGVPLWMTEHSLGMGYDNALAWGKEVQRLLVEDGVSAVDFMWGYFGAWEKLGAALIELEFTSNGLVRTLRTHAYYVTGQYARYLKRGDRIVDARSDDPAVSATAATGRGELSIVLVNEAREPREARVQVRGFRGRSASAERTTMSEAWVKTEARLEDGDTLVIALAPKSVTSLRMSAN